MNWFLNSKFFSNCRPKKLFDLQPNVIMSMINNSYQKFQPVHMAYTVYETISPEGKDNVPILILHGLLGSKTNWSTMGRQIAVTTLRKVLTLDARNHGDSPHTKDFSYSDMVVDLKYLMKELEIKEASLLGHSFGGRVMMAFALSNPQLVRDLVIVDVSPFSMGESFNYLPLVLRTMKQVKVSSINEPIHKVREEVNDQLKLSIKSEQLRSFLLMNLSFDQKKKKYYWKLNLKTLSDTLPSLLDFPKYEGVYDKPTLFIAGAQSDHLKKEDEPKIVQKFPKAEFRFVNDAGHLVHINKPDEFLNLISAFYTKTN